MLRFALLIAIVSLSHAAALSQSQPAADPFAYDSKLPLDFREAGVQQLPGATVRDVSYASPKGGRVPAYLVVPEGRGPFAAVEFVHWGQGDRTEFLSEALVYAKGGAVSLLIDAPYRRPDYKQGPSFIDDPQADRDLYVQLVIDARRGLDLLLSRPDVDPARVAYVGHSLGATWGGALAGVERRVVAYVLMGGLPSITDFSGESAFARDVRERYKPEQIERYAALVSPINPENFVGRARGARLFFQFARWDRYISRDAASRYVGAASRPKIERTYNTSHEFNDLNSWCDRNAWIVEALRQTGAARPPACAAAR